MSNKIEKLHQNNQMKQIKVFLTVADCGGVVNAAKKLCITFGAVSETIAALEYKLNMKLFDRSAKNLKLNENGKRFYEMVYGHFNGLNSAIEIMQKESYNERIRFAGHDIITNIIMPQIMKQMHDENDKIRFFIDLINREQALEKILNDELDFAIFPISINDIKHYEDKFDCKKLMQYKLKLICHKNSEINKKIQDGKKLTFQMWIEHSIIDMTKDLISIEKMQQIKLSSSRNNNIVFLNYPNYQTIINMVSANLGTIIINEKWIINDNNIIEHDANHLHEHKIFFVLFTKIGSNVNININNIIQLIIKK